MIAFLIILGGLLAAFGIFNYVLATLKSKGISISPNVHTVGNWIIVVVFLGILTFLSAVLVKNPGAILTHLHWVWVMIIGIVVFITLVVIGIVLAFKDYDHMGFSLVVTGVCTLGLMITGLCLCKNVEYYEISSARGFNLLDNLPGKDGAYTIYITDDIDFKGRTIDGSFGDEDQAFYIYGNGHTVKNIRYEGELEESVNFIYGSGTINDLKFIECEYYLTPNSYDKETHRGHSVDFNVLGDFDFTNVEIEAVVYKLPSTAMEALYENESIVGEIKPAALPGGNNKINIVVKEGEQ